MQDKWYCSVWATTWCDGTLSCVWIKLTLFRHLIDYQNIWLLSHVLQYFAACSVESRCSAAKSVNRSTISTGNRPLRMSVNNSHFRSSLSTIAHSRVFLTRWFRLRIYFSRLYSVEIGKLFEHSTCTCSSSARRNPRPPHGVIHSQCRQRRVQLRASQLFKHGC